MLKSPDGSLNRNDDDHSHWATWEEASAHQGDAPGAIPTELEQPCTFLRCAHCGYGLAEDYDILFHYNGPEERGRTATEEGWSQCQNEAWVCPGCPTTCPTT